MKNERGNVLFLILIAVALFAALSYAVTQSNRGGGNADDETNNIVMSQYTQLVADLRVSVQRMILSGTSIDDIDICNGASTTCGTNFCTVGENCLFAPEGGGFDVSRLEGEYGINMSEALGGFKVSGHPNSQIWTSMFKINNKGSLESLSLSQCEAINEGYDISTIEKEQTFGATIADGLSVSGSWGFCFDGAASPGVTSYTTYSVIAVN